MGIAIVTGASRGIGAAVASKLAVLGHSVCVNYRQQSSAAQQLVESIVNQGCLLYTSPSPRDLSTSRMPSSA